MSTDDTATPVGHFDEGEPIYYVCNEDGIAVAFHRSKQGAEYSLRFLAGAVGINEGTLGPV